MTQEVQDIAVQAAKAVPAVAGAATTALTLNEWVAVATGVYILIQAVYLLRKWWREESEWAKRVKERRQGDRRQSERP